MHDINNDYPLAPEKINIPEEWLSDYCSKIANFHNITTETVKKLRSNLMTKNNYVIYYRNLQQCLELEIKLKKIHRILKFKQSNWMRPYIDFNTKKEQYQIMKLIRIFLISVYGKTIENLRKRIKIRVVKNSQDFIKYTSRPTCVNWKVFENNLAAIHEKNISNLKQTHICRIYSITNK